MKRKPSTITETNVNGQQYRLSFFEPAPRAADTKTVTIKEMPLSEQPAARMEYYGAGALSIAELLALAAGFLSLEDAQQLLQKSGNLVGLAQAPWSELVAIKGIGPQRAARIKSAFELGRRLLVATPMERPIVKSPADAANLLLLEMAQYEQEHLISLILDSKNRVLKSHLVYIGSLNTAVVRVGELFREAIRLNAAAVLIAHNHPSTDVTPSAEDVYVTRQIVEAGKLLSIDVLDHIIIGGNRWCSLKERGLGF